MAAGMNAPLYTTEILRLAASLPEPATLERIDCTAEERSPTCGSRVRSSVQLAPTGRIEALSQEVHACAFGQASAALLARTVEGRSGAEVAAAMATLEAWLAGADCAADLWPGYAALEPALSRRSRHPAILLPMRALLAAMSDRGR